MNLYQSLTEQARTLQFDELDDQIYFANNERITDPNLILRKLMERAIVRRLVTDVLAHPLGYTISLHDGEDWALRGSRNLNEIMGTIMSVDEETLRIDGVGRIFLVYGNDGWDVICDHSVNAQMGVLLAGANDLSDSLCDMSHDASQ